MDVDNDDGTAQLRRRRAPASLWCGSAQGILLAVSACTLALIYQTLVLGPYDARQTARAFGGWERDPWEAAILGEGSPAIDMQCDLTRLHHANLPPDAFERLYRGKRPVVLMGRGPGQGWTPAARRRGPWFLPGGQKDGAWTLEGLRAVLDSGSEEEGEEGALLRVLDDGRRRLGSWWGDGEGEDGSCEAGGDGEALMTLDAYLSMGARGLDYEKEEGEEEEEDEEEEAAYLCDPAALQAHPGLRASSLGQLQAHPPAPLAHAFGDATTTASFLAVGRSRGGLPWHVVAGETWIGAVAGGFTQWFLYPPGRGLRNVTMGHLGKGHTHPLLSPWEFAMHALPFLDHHGPDDADADGAGVTPSDVPPLSCLLRPGDVLYIPGGGWKAMRFHVGDALLVGGVRPAAAAATPEARLAESFAVLQRNPLDVEALLQAGRAAADADDKELALAHLRKAVGLRPCDDAPHVALAEALWRFGGAYREEAAAVLRVAEGVFALEEVDGEACPLPRWMSERRARRLLAGARTRLARAWLRIGEDAEARRALQEIVELDAGYGPARAALAALG